MYSHMCVCYPFLLLSSINGYLDTFHILAIIKHAAMSMGCSHLLEVLILFPLGTYPGVGLLDHKVGLFLIFEAPPYCYP